MKLAPLLAEYLLTNKTLDLPGIGTFRVEQANNEITDPSNKDKKSAPASKIFFENDPAIKNSPELIQFIADKTGKQKTLATSDLNSHMELIHQFLNIGKPFLLEGIGSIVKLKSKEYAFTSGQQLPESMKDYSPKEISSTSSSEPSFADYRKPLNRNTGSAGWKRPVSVLLIIIGIGLAVWGGYTVYKMTTTQNRNLQTNDKATNEPLIRDSATLKQDSIPEINTVQEIKDSTGTMKFVLEKSTAKRAFKRFEQLKSYFWPVQIETRDSILYTIYMNLRASAADSTAMKDSLTELSGRRVYIE